MARILTIDPNSSEACSGGLSRALEPFRFAGGPVFDVVTLIEGPPAIYTWRDWHSGVEPTCRLVERSDANEYVVACASDPGIEAMRTATSLRSRHIPFSRGHGGGAGEAVRGGRAGSGSGWVGIDAGDGAGRGCPDGVIVPGSGVIARLAEGDRCALWMPW
jgi:hypothetical protein